MTPEETHLHNLAKQIAAYRDAQKPPMSTAALIRKVPQLGSDKTFTRFLNGDFAQTDIEKWTAEYQAAVNWIDSVVGSDEPEPLCDDLSVVTQLRTAWSDARKTVGNARVILVLGKSGSGKTSAVRVLMQKNGTGIRLVEANEAWNDSPSAMLGAVLRALDVTTLPASASDRLEMAVQKLTESRLTLIIEEAHHLRCRLLDIVKTLVNRTPGEFVLVAIDTLWTRMATPAYEQARQLTGNRISSIIRIGDIQIKDVEKLIRKRINSSGLEVNEIAKALCVHAPNYGRLAFVRSVIGRVVNQCLQDETTATASHFAVALAAEKGAR